MACSRGVKRHDQKDRDFRLSVATRVKLGLGALNVVTGANGSGKSSLYRAVRPLADIAQGPR